MYSNWTKHLKTEEERTRFQNSLLGSKLIFNRLTELIKEREASLENQSVDFENPNWAYKQANILGQKQALSAIKQLINFDPKKDN